MKIGIFTRGKNSHSHIWEEAFAEGLEKHGIQAIRHTIGDRPRDLDCGVIWGVHNKSLTDHFKAHDIDYIVLERGYIGDRTEWTSCGFNGLNGLGDFRNDDVGDERRHHVVEHLQPVRKSKGSYILIMGQIASDASVKRIGFNKWLQKTYDEIKDTTDKKVYYRPHPLDTNAFIPEGLEVINGDFHDVIAKAYCVVTLNSNSGVDTLLAGVPVISMDRGSMVYDVTKHLISDIINPEMLQRDQWLNKIAYCQWTMKEIKSGATWEYLRGKYD